ncbi:MAG: SusD/RagB family nutrient-binding outer membrane lipoprotein [Bacteroidetes bacterium]|nr:SusD/RagB family nutrient-binding outer membrane lipoprotein [Bacteroidota bacterium]
MKFRKIYITLTIAFLVAFTGCKKEFNGYLNNPNSPSPSTADVDLYLNSVQLSFNTFWTRASDLGAQLTRQQYWVGPFYRNGYTPASFDGEWTNAYTGVLANSTALIPLAQEQKKYVQSGIARTLTAFTLGTLVDDFGDVPYTDAVLGNENTNPNVDPGATVYAGVQTLLDSAIADFQKPGAAAGPSVDLFYGGDADAWVTFAKTLKLRFYMQTRLVDASAKAKIEELLAEDDLINDPSQDFVFQYGTSLSAPDSRHPQYGANYVDAGGPGYLSNFFMWMVASQKYGGTVNFNGDPRLRYYFYRASLNYNWANSSTCPCFARSIFATSAPPAWYPSVPDETPYCVIGKGYLGRDHGDASGGPPDGSFRSTYGIYPAGGEFDSDGGDAINSSLGLKGAGIDPIWLSSYTAFLKAEAATTLGITAAGTPRALLQAGVTASIDKVLGFPLKGGYTVPSDKIPSTTQINNYINLVLSKYDAATTDADKLNVIMTEYYLAAWGNGVEPYNNYRRTGMPNNMQPPAAVPEPGLFMRSFFYPSVFVNRNVNAPAQKNPGNAADKVFWDNNPDDFVK